MARPRSDDPLKVCSLRLPTSLVDRIEAAAAFANRSRSDVVRQYLEIPAESSISPTFRPTPSKRQRELARPIRADPELLRQLAAIGNNLNQLARQVNSAGWELIDRVELLAALQEIRFELDRLEP